MLYGYCFKLCRTHCALSPLGVLICVVLGAFMLPWGSLARWLAFLILPFLWRLTRPLHGRSPCILSDFYGQVSPPWPAWICCAIMRCWFLEVPCSLLPAGIILWNGDCCLSLFFIALAKKWLVIVVLHEGYLIQIPVLSSQSSTIGRYVEDWIWW